MALSIDNKIAMIKLIRMYGKEIHKALGFGTFDERQALRVQLYKKMEEEGLSDTEKLSLELIKQVDKSNGLKFAKDFVEGACDSGDISYHLVVGKSA